MTPIVKIATCAVGKICAAKYFTSTSKSTKK